MAHRFGLNRKLIFFSVFVLLFYWNPNHNYFVKELELLESVCVLWFTKLLVQTGYNFPKGRLSSEMKNPFNTNVWLWHGLVLFIFFFRFFFRVKETQLSFLIEVIFDKIELWISVSILVVEEIIHFHIVFLRLYEVRKTLQFKGKNELQQEFNILGR